MVLSSEFFPSPRAGASGMMEMTPARVQNQGFRQIVGHRLSPTVLEDHPWIRWLGSAGLDQNEVDAPAARTGKFAFLDPGVGSRCYRLASRIEWLFGVVLELREEGGSPKQPQTTDSKTLIKNWLCCAPG